MLKVGQKLPLLPMLLTQAALPLRLPFSVQNNVPYQVPGYRSAISAELEKEGLSDEDGALAVNKVQPLPCFPPSHPSAAELLLQDLVHLQRAEWPAPGAPAAGRASHAGLFAGASWQYILT